MHQRQPLLLLDSDVRLWLHSSKSNRSGACAEKDHGDCKMGSDCSCKCHTKTSTRKQADSRYDPKDDPMSWQREGSPPGRPDVRRPQGPLP